MVIIASIFVFCVAAIFRLLDNSAGVLISNGISVNPFYLSRKEVKEQIARVKDKELAKKLRRILVFQTLHKIFLILSIVMFLAGIAYEFYDPLLIHLF
ncbi:MAG: hypothetical protein CL868_02655 [Cytophagaceae bacterium]|nr:hypothetical protein [Cytophagaceae bacterium]|tara:strand:+ start:17288 stop:17581 length:294 start_codon:yes stop_codon:yes gene_type:complete